MRNSVSVSVPGETTIVAVDRTGVFNDILSLDGSKCTVTVCLASVERNETIPRFERLQMTEKLAKGFSASIETLLKQYRKDVKAEELLFPEYYIESMPEEYEIEVLDLSAYTAILEQMNPLASLMDVEVFSNDEQFVAGLRFYVIILQPSDGDPVYFFRTHTQKKVLSRSGLLAILRNDGTYDHVEESVMVFDQSIDCMSRNGVMFIIDKKNFQTIFRFFETIRIQARETLSTINAGIPIHNLEELTQACEGNLLMLRKLKKIAAKPYLKKITMKNVKKVIELNKLAVKIVEVDGQEKLLFDAKARPREKWAILRVLNDDYLKSIMTDQNYEVTGKREV